MRTTLSPRLLKIANIAAKIPVVKVLLKPLYYPYKQKIQVNRNRVFRQNALDTLRDFDRVMTENHIAYSVFAGTLLGAIRDKGFIKHDLDIDIMMYYQDYSKDNRKILELNGFKLDHSFKIDNGKIGMEETYIKNGVTIDIFYIYSDNNYSTYQCDFLPCEGCTSCEDSMNRYGFLRARRIEFPIEYSFDRIDFENIKVNAISNATEWLSKRYGHDYITPNPEFRDKGDNPYMYIWEGVKAIFTSYLHL